MKSDPLVTQGKFHVMPHYFFDVLLWLVASAYRYGYRSRYLPYCDHSFFLIVILFLILVALYLCLLLMKRWHGGWVIGCAQNNPSRHGQLQALGITTECGCLWTGR